MTRTSMPLVCLPATSVTNRARLRASESFSPPSVSRRLCRVASSLDDGPWANSRTLVVSRVPSSALLLPTMSLVNIPSTLTPWAL